LHLIITDYYNYQLLQLPVADYNYQLAYKWTVNNITDGLQLHYDLVGNN